MQMPDRSKIVVGGGHPEEVQNQTQTQGCGGGTKMSVGSDHPYGTMREEEGTERECWQSISQEDWVLGIAPGNDLFQGTSSPCVTFQSTTLVAQSGAGDRRIFEFCNLEVWSFTPCQNVKEVEQLELGRMFVLSHFES